MANFSLHDEQKIKALMKIAWASVFRLMSPCLHVSSSQCLYSISPCFDVSVSMSPCFHVSISMFPCLNVSMSPCLFVSLSMSPHSCIPQMKTKLLENGNGKLPFVCCKRKRKTDVCFLWPANDKWIDECCFSKRAHLWWTLHILYSA